MGNLITNGFKFKRFVAGDRKNTPDSASVMNRILDGLESLLNWRVVQTNALLGKVVIGNNGCVLELPLPSSGAIPVSIRQYRFKVYNGDTVTARTWDGTTEGTDETIGKPWELRHSLTTETTDGVQIDYSSYDLSHQTRVATIHGTATTEKQQVVPWYHVNDLIYVATYQIDAAGLITDKLDINACARAWCRKWNQS